MPAQTFRAQLERPEGVGTWTYLRIPPAVMAAYEARGQVKVTGTIEGHPFRGSAMPRGDGTHFLVVNKTIRDAIGAHAGASVEVTLEADSAPRDVDVPLDLAQALAADQPACQRFAALSYSHQKEYIDWIEAARKPETRTRRIQATLERVTTGARLKS
jgi:hypothetical protein